METESDVSSHLHAAEHTSEDADKGHPHGVHRFSPDCKQCIICYGECISKFFFSNPIGIDLTKATACFTRSDRSITNMFFGAVRLTGDNRREIHSMVYPVTENYTSIILSYRHFKTDIFSERKTVEIFIELARENEYEESGMALTPCEKMVLTEEQGKSSDCQKLSSEEIRELQEMQKEFIRKQQEFCQKHKELCKKHKELKEKQKKKINEKKVEESKAESKKEATKVETYKFVFKVLNLTNGENSFEGYLIDLVMNVQGYFYKELFTDIFDLENVSETSTWLAISADPSDDMSLHIHSTPKVGNKMIIGEVSAGEDLLIKIAKDEEFQKCAIIINSGIIL